MRKIVYYVVRSIAGFISGLIDDISSFVGTGNGVDKYLANLANFDTVILGKILMSLDISMAYNPDNLHIHI